MVIQDECKLIIPGAIHIFVGICLLHGEHEYILIIKAKRPGTSSRT